MLLVLHVSQLALMKWREREGYLTSLSFSFLPCLYCICCGVREVDEAWVKLFEFQLSIWKVQKHGINDTGKKIWVCTFSKLLLTSSMSLDLYLAQMKNSEHVKSASRIVFGSQVL